ncbi:phosphate transporter [Grosmannia clavigera kw1407]|uniref:Phosphate transporter n=1 Tax=Grosmannia clavigera (strain kw1407 / UAMH 11150) TaxID=655863 RepID=F0XC81_GROCL|nr:phosphate transporter [Grosmannia clavigera kw1407]EFX04113.1 phosphate transporter [Grosmannia clavigera kw1407]
MAAAVYPEPECRSKRGFLGPDNSALSLQDRHAKYRHVGTLINVFTLLGSVVGQLCFGFLADYYGRTRLYGIELVLVIVSTIGVATSNYGYKDLSFLGLFIWWRFVMGIGIGAEYPLSAVITAEWASTSSRATMLSSVFLMQPVGQALAQPVGLWVVLGREDLYHLQAMQCGINTKNEDRCRQAIDGIWRIVIGSGAVPALLGTATTWFLLDVSFYGSSLDNSGVLADLWATRSPPALDSSLFC